MKTIKAQELNRKAFRQYGTYQNLLDNADMAEASVRKAGFFADLLTLNFGGETLPAVSVCHVKQEEKNIIAMIEAHKNTCEGLLPLDADVLMFFGRLVNGEPDPETIESFVVPKGTFVKLEPLVVHGRQFAIKAAEAHILCLLPQRTFNNDMIKKVLGDNEKIEILV